MKLQIKIQQKSKDKGLLTGVVIKGELTTLHEPPMSAHDVAGLLFAIEFACNNYSQLPMRVHIEQIQ